MTRLYSTVKQRSDPRGCMVPIGLLLALAACESTEPPPPATETGDSSTSGDGDGDGDPTTGDGDGDGDPTGELGEARTVFVTAATHAADFGGLAGADSICQDAALAVTGGDTEAAAAYRAWLGTAGQSAAERLEHWPSRYVRTDGSQIAADWDNLVDGGLDVRINVDEFGNQVEGATLVWTGTSPDGSFAGQSCASWSSTVAAEIATVGSVDDDGQSWTAFGETSCDQKLRLYCVEQSEVVALECSALAFDGVDDLVTAANFTGQVWTVEAWIKPVSQPGQRAVVSQIDNGNWFLDFELGLNAGEPFVVVGTGGSWRTVAWPETIEPGVWHHIAGIYDGAAINLAVDGVLASPLDAAYMQSDASLHIGTRPSNGFFFEGEISEVRVSSVVRYTSTFSPQVNLANDADTARLWTFAEGMGEQTLDEASATLDDISGTATWLRSCPLEPACGDGQVSGFEQCDDQNSDESDGCFADCTVPRSCAEILAANPAATTGLYTIAPYGPPGVVEVTCDMDTDGGGWTGILVEQTCDTDGLPDTGYFESTVTALEPASMAGADPMCRQYTQDVGWEQHYYTWDVEFPAGFDEFYLSSYVIKANAAMGHTSDIGLYPLPAQWEFGPDVYFGSALDLGPVTSYGSEGVGVSCFDCETPFMPDLMAFGVGELSTQFRVAWGEGGVESEGWYPWWSGMVFLRGPVCGDGLVEGSEQCDDQNDDPSDGCMANCAVPSSCLDVINAKPNAPSGEYLIDPGSGPFTVYCEMSVDGGGWTLVFNEFADDFVADADGLTDQTCFASNCINRAYSTVPVVGDMLLDASDVDMVDDDPETRVRIIGLHAPTLGHTVRELFTTAGPWYAEAEDNSNLFHDNYPCPGPWPGYDLVICGNAVVSFHDPPGCSAPIFEIGTEWNYTTFHNNCAGWSGAGTVYGPKMGASPGNQLPNNFRIWVR